MTSQQVACLFPPSSHSTSSSYTVHSLLDVGHQVLVMSSVWMGLAQDHRKWDKKLEAFHLHMANGYGIEFPDLFPEPYNLGLFNKKTLKQKPFCFQRGRQHHLPVRHTDSQKGNLQRRRSQCALHPCALLWQLCPCCWQVRLFYIYIVRDVQLQVPT